MIMILFPQTEHEEFKDRPDLLFMDPAIVSCMMIQCTGKCYMFVHPLLIHPFDCIRHLCLDQEELDELAQGLNLDRRSIMFIPVNDSEAFHTGCTHW